MHEADALARFFQVVSHAAATLADELLKTAPVPEAGSVDRLLPISVAATRLGFSVTYLYRHSHELPFMRRHGRSWRVSQHALDEYAKSAGRRDPAGGT